MDQVLQVDSAPVLSQVPEAAVAHCRRDKVQVKLVLFRKGGPLVLLSFYETMLDYHQQLCQMISEGRAACRKCSEMGGP